MISTLMQVRIKRDDIRKETSIVTVMVYVQKALIKKKIIKTYSLLFSSYIFISPFPWQNF